MLKQLARHNVIATFLCTAVVAQGVAVVIDGDTVEQDGVTYRIHGIDAPEFSQCHGNVIRRTQLS